MSSNIDPLMQLTAAPASKPVPAPSPREDNKFADVLRVAEQKSSETAEAPATDPVAKAKPVVDSARGQTGRGNRDSSSEEQQQGPIEVTEIDAEAPIDEETAVDEVLLSVAAEAIFVGAEIPVVEPELVVAVNTVDFASDGEPQQPPVFVATETATPFVETAIYETDVSQPTEPVASEIPAAETDNTAEVPVPTALVAESNTIVEQTAPVSTAVAQAALPTKTKQQPATNSAVVENMVPVEDSFVKTSPESRESDNSKAPADKPKNTANGVLSTVIQTAESADVKIGARDKVDSSVEAIQATPSNSTAEPSTNRGAEPAPPTASNTTKTTEPTASRSEQPSPQVAVDRARFVQRVANAFRSAHHDDGHIQMKLSPPELGSLRIEIAVRNGVLTANLETETADARKVLIDNLPALRQRLAEQDIRIEKFDVDVRREGQSSGGQAETQDRQAQQQSQRAAAQNRLRTTTTSEIITARVPRSPASADAGLDVRI